MNGRAGVTTFIGFIQDHALRAVQAALPVAPDTTASIAADLSQAEAAVEDGTFVGFQGAQQLYVAMLDRRQQQTSSRVAYAGAFGLSGQFRRAKVSTPHSDASLNPC